MPVPKINIGMLLDIRWLKSECNRGEKNMPNKPLTSLGKTPNTNKSNRSLKSTNFINHNRSTNNNGKTKLYLSFFISSDFSI